MADTCTLPGIFVDPAGQPFGNARLILRPVPGLPRATSGGLIVTPTVPDPVMTAEDGAVTLTLAPGRYSGSAAQGIGGASFTFDLTVPDLETAPLEDYIGRIDVEVQTSAQLARDQAVAAADSASQSAASAAAAAAGRYVDLAAVEQASVPSGLPLVQVAGRTLVPDPAGPVQSANLQRFSPPDRRFDIVLAGTSSDLVNDFDGICAQWIVDCATRGWTGVIGRSEAPHEPQQVYIYDMPGDLRLDLTGARFYPKADFNDFACDGVTNSFTLGGWFDGSLANLSCCYLTSGSTYEVLDPLTDLQIVNGNTIRVTPAAPPAGYVLRVANRNAAFGLRCLDGSRRKFSARGGWLDLGRRGYVPTRASGSAWGLRNFDYPFWDGAPVVTNSGGTLTGDLYARRSDSAWGLNNCHGGEFHGAVAEGMGDLAFYITGDASTGPQDDGWGFRLIGGTSYRCANDIKDARQGGGITVIGRTIHECSTGILNGDTGEMEAARNYQIIGYMAYRTARRVFDLRLMDRGSRINAMIEDWGYRANGTAVDDAAAIFIANSRMIDADVTIKQRAWAKPPGRAAIQVSGINHGHTIRAAVSDAAIGFNETGGSGPGEYGGRLDIVTQNVDTPCQLLSGSKWEVVSRTMTEAAGQITGAVVTQTPFGVIHPGPHASAAAASLAGVPPGATFRRSDGLLAWNNT